jgi:hypothetical protein
MLNPFCVDLRSTSSLAALLRAFAPQHPEAAMARLNRPQVTMAATEFELCTARLVPLVSRRTCWRDSGTGVLTLSEPYFNAARDQALIAYGWNCYGNCGYGAVLWVERVQGGR